MMMKMALIGALCVLVVAGIGSADWDPPDGHKMHFPQTPKMVGGWDVKASYYRMLADDWQCSKSGLVTDIHVWVSYMDDLYFVPDKVHTAIWSDDPVGDSGIVGEDPTNTYSKPLDQLWHKDWVPPEFSIRYWDEGPQGWYDPQFDIVDPQPPLDPALNPDHRNVYQINMFLDPLQEEVFSQVEGTIYWLEFSVPEPIEGNIGWKQSDRPFQDDAVWRPEANENWEELYDPFTGESMDLAFVITPEPTTVGLMLFGLFALLRRKR